MFVCLRSPMYHRRVLHGDGRLGEHHEGSAPLTLDLLPVTFI